MDCYTIFIAHLVELIYADDAAVREHHCTSFQVELPRLRVSLHRGCQTSCTGPLTGRVDRDGRALLDELKELRFRCARVTEEKDVDVAAQLHAVGEDFLAAAHEEAGNGFFDVGIAVDGGRDAGSEAGVEVRQAGNFFEFLDFGVREGLGRRGVGCVCCDADGTEVGVADGDAGGRGFGGLLGLVDGEDSHDGAAGAGDDAVGEVAVGGDEDVAGELANGDLVRSFLEFDDLLVDELRFLMHDEVWV